MTTFNTPPSSETPNVVVKSPTVRRIINATLFTAGVLLGTVVVVDGTSDAFDLTDITGPASAGLLYLGSAFGFAVTLPNIPR